MTLRKFLLIPVAISLIYVAIYWETILDSAQVMAANINPTAVFIGVIILAIVLQLAGHLIRALKASFILRPIRRSSVRFQFRALSLGYLFNAILPLRLGELVRSYVMATGEKMSWGLSLAVVMFERSIDALFIGLVAFILAVAGLVPLQNIIFIGLALLAFAALVLTVIVLLVCEYQPALKAAYKVSNLFNARLKQSSRFKLWSVIYGLQQILKKGSVVKYVALSAASWVLYIGSTLLIVSQFSYINTTRDAVLSAASPYYGTALPAGPASLGQFSQSARAVNGPVSMTEDERLTFMLVSWATMVLPISLVALILLLVKTKEPLRRHLRASSSSSSLMDKLSREEDISANMETFLDNYFEGNKLSRVVHRLENEGKFHLLKYFKGGSDAITVLVARNDKSVVVKKIIALEYMDRLKAQHDWLIRHNHKGIVDVLDEEVGKDYYSIDLAYDPDDEMFFDFLHHSTSEKAQNVIKTVWESLHETLYKDTKKVTDYDALNAYVDKHIWGCLDQASAVYEDLVAATKPKQIIINGNKYDNIHEIMKKIFNHKKAMKDLATFARSDEVDGDIALDNIMVSRKTSKPRIIDPAPDGNIITGPVFDFGKNMQSLYCGYEFLFRSPEKVILEDGNQINFHDQRSGQYVELCDYVRYKLAPQYLSKGEQKAIIFHAAALHIRRLKHQVKQNPDMALAMYATGVRTLNDFLRQYS